MAQSDQIQVHSTFNNKSTGLEVLADVNLKGKIAIVTGGYSGIGLETTKALAAKGVKVIVPARSMEKASKSLKSLEGTFIRHLWISVISNQSRILLIT